MSTQIIRPTTQQDWLEVRKSGIGSSEVATIVGLNPFETPYELWRRKRGNEPAKEETFAMKAGHYLEDAVSRFWSDETGREVIKSSAGDWLIRSKERPYMQVSPDRTYWLEGKHSNTNKGILECKTTQLPVDGDDLPKHWFCQVQYQLGVAEVQQGSLAWLTQGREFGYRDIAFVPDFFDWLATETEKFYKDNILGGAEPAAVSVRDILLKYNRHSEGKIIEIGEDIYTAYNELKELRVELARLEERKQELEDKIKLGFGDAEAISYGGDTIATWKAPKPSAKIDTKAMAAAYPDIVRQYTTEVQGARRFLLK
ncbi:MAG: YqaJ viral recombinase family protein [Bacteroidaceae bacterium]|nr:YqaJ viral recombinase family protein [Bacteroidaceae bacterium]